MKYCLKVVEVFPTSFKSTVISAVITFTFTQLIHSFPQSTFKKFTICCESPEFIILSHPLFLSKTHFLLTFTPTYFSFPKVNSVNETFTLKVALFKQSITQFDSDSH